LPITAVAPVAAAGCVINNPAVYKRRAAVEVAIYSAPEYTAAPAAATGILITGSIDAVAGIAAGNSGVSNYTVFDCRTGVSLNENRAAGRPPAVLH